MTVSVVMSVTNRPAHLRNTLRSWCNIEKVDTFTVIDNASGRADENEQIANGFKDRLNLTFYREPAWLNMNVVWNKYGKMTTGEYLIFAMQDEIVVGKDLVSRMMDNVPFRSSIFTYFMNRDETAAINGIPWKDDPTLIPKPFTDQTSAGLISHVTGAYRFYWNWFGWFRNDERGHLWLDQDLHLRELALVNHCRTPKDVYCLHQHHPTSPLPNNFMQPGYQYKTERQARLLDPAERDAA